MFKRILNTVLLIFLMILVFGTQIGFASNYGDTLVSLFKICKLVYGMSLSQIKKSMGKSLVVHNLPSGKYVTIQEKTIDNSNGSKAYIISNFYMDENESVNSTGIIGIIDGNNEKLNSNIIRTLRKQVENKLDELDATLEGKIYNVVFENVPYVLSFRTFKIQSNEDTIKSAKMIGIDPSKYSENAYTIIMIVKPANK